MKILSAYFRAMLAGEGTIAALVGARIYDSALERGAQPPAIVYSVRPGTTGPVKGLTETPMQSLTVDVDCVAETEAGAWTLYGVVHDALVAEDQRVVNGETLSGISQVDGPELARDEDTGWAFVTFGVAVAMET